MQLSRTTLLIGADGIEKLKKARVAVFGVGGVGGFVAESLARSGVGNIDLIDNDKVSLSNINRQIIALHSTVGRMKTQVMAERIKDINPEICVCTHELFYLPETADKLDFSVYDYIVDAIDTVSGKIAIVENANKKKIPVISSMGTGNKLDPTALTITDITKTTVCPLARVMRRELKKRGIAHLKVVFSTEEPKKPISSENTKTPPASVAFVPSVAGLIAASDAVKTLLSK